MNVQDIVEITVDKFKQKLTEIYTSVEKAGQLSPDLAIQIEFGLGESAMEAARLGFTHLLESFDIDEEVLEVDGEIYRRKPQSPKRFLTFLGEIEVNRTLYQRDCGGRSHIPLDESWGMRGEYATPRVKESALFLMACMCPKEVEASLKKSSWFHPSSTLVKKLTADVGSFVEKNEEKFLDAIRSTEEVPSETKSFVASMDGANVLLNEPGPRKGRPFERPCGEKNPEGKTSYRNAMVGSFSFYGDVPENHQCPERLLSKYLAHMPEEKAPTFKERFESEMRHWDSLLEGEVKKVFLADGHKSIWGYVKKKSEIFADYKMAVDFYHTTEHLSKAAEALFGKSSPEAQKWYYRWRENLLMEEGAARGVIRSIRYMLKSHKLSKSKREEVRKELTFFRRNWRLMPYAVFREMGLPIGSGPVEAACKSIVKTRMCRSGMRWSRKGGQYVLQLRTIVKSERWEPFWQEYLRLKNAA